VPCGHGSIPHAEAGVIEECGSPARSHAQVQPGEVQLFLGGAEWTAGQLESELREGLWLLAHGPHEVLRVLDTSAANCDDVDVNRPCLWEHMLKEMGGEYAHFAGLPEAVTSRVTEE
ncbi:hypothetical protein CYMTET_26057, partial [Cymbomonas tetramitiformis]